MKKILEYTLLTVLLVMSSIGFADPKKIVIVSAGSPTGGMVLTSTDHGVTWSQTQVPNVENFYNVSFVNNKYLAPTFEGNLAVSDDAQTWSVQKFNFYVYDAAWANNLYVVTQTTGVYSSPDAINWTPHDLNPYGGGAILWDGKQFITAFTAIYTSTDGLNWTLRKNGNANLVGIAWDKKSTYVIASAGYSGTSFLTSADGKNWDDHPLVTPSYIRSIAWGNNIFVAVGDEGVIFTSPDGVNWTQQNSGTVLDLNRVRWLEDQFIAVGSAKAWKDTSPILTSVDGIHWTLRDSGTNASLYGVA